MASTEPPTLRVFIGCPGDMVPERAELLKLEKHLLTHGCPIKFLIWPDVPPGPGRPQQVIFDYYPIHTWDIFIGLLWSRFGTDAGETDPKTGARMTGTEEEFKRAYSSWLKDGRRPHIALYRCVRPLPVRHDRKQFEAVCAFFEQLGVDGHYPALCQEFKTKAAFAKRVEEDLLKIVHNLNNGIGETAADTLVPPASTVLYSSIPHNLREPRALLYGRIVQIETLAARLSAGLTQGGLALSGLRGMGGVGKTELALAIAKRLIPRCPDGRFFLDLLGVSKEPLTPMRIAEAILRQFDPAAPVFEDIRAALDALVQVLHTRVQTGFLLVLDNAYDTNQVAPFLRLPSTILLITSRQRLHLEGVTLEDVDTLSELDAVELLTRESGGRLAGELAIEASRLCGFLPQALLAFGGAVAGTTRPTSEMLTLLRERRQYDTRKAIETVFSVSEEQLGDVERLQWRQLGVFPEAFDRHAAAAVWSDPDDEAVQNHLDALHHRHLLEWDETTARYRLHDIARPYAIGHLTPDEIATAQERHAEHYCCVLSDADDLYLCGQVLEGLALFDRERGNISAGHSWACSAEGEAAERLRIAFPDAGIYVLSLRFHVKEQVTWLEGALASARRTRNKQAEGQILGNLGIRWGELGEPRKAVSFLDEALVVLREIGDRLGEGSVLSNLGNRWAELGELRKAIDLYEQALVIAREVNNDRGKGIALGNLGTRWAELDEPRKAIDFFEQALVIAREVGDRRGEGADLTGLGMCWANLGDPRKAIDFYEQALSIDRELGDRRGEATDLTGLGNRYVELGEVHKAIKFYKEALCIRREIGDRRGECTDLYNLGSQSWQIGDRLRAIDLLKESLRISEAIEDPRASAVRAILKKWGVQF